MSITPRRAAGQPRPLAPAGQLGNLGRGTFIGPNLRTVDLSLLKNFNLDRWNEQARLQFRIESFNLFNRANFANPPARLNNALGNAASQLQPGQPFNLSAAGGAFGIANSTVTKDVGLGASRQIQLSLRLTF